MSFEYNKPIAPTLSLDKNWVRKIFMVGDKEIDGLPMHLRNWSTADIKFQNTTLGGSIVINPLPQPNVFTDPPDPNHVLGGAMDERISPYFSENFDDNYRVVSFRFGTMGFTSLIGFLSGMYHPGAAALANKGRVHQILFQIGSFVGSAFQIVAWPIIFANFVYKGLQFAIRKPTSKFAYLKPGMPQYWIAVQNILNHFMVNSNLVFPEDPTGMGQDVDGRYNIDKATRDATMKMFPDLYPHSNFLGDEGMRLDVNAVANKAQRMAHAMHDNIERLNKANGDVLKLKNIVSRIYREHSGRTGNTMAQYVNKWMKTEFYSVEGGRGTLGSGEKEGDPDAFDTMIVSEISKVDGEGKSTGVPNPNLWDFTLSEIRDGSAYVHFRVNDTGAVTESFTNNYKSSALEDKVNSMAGTSRDAFYNTAGGSIGNDIVSDAIEGIIGGAKAMFEGFATSVGLGGFLIAGGGGKVTMPKYWESSDVSMPSMNYEINLKARHPNPRSILQDIMVPLACLLAAVKPLATGKHSYTNPFYCEFYDRGRAQTRLGAISSMTVTRGDGTMGFTPTGKALSVTVSFTVTMMEEIPALPISESFSAADTISSVAAGALVNPLLGVANGIKSIAEQLLKGIFDDDTPFMDYMAVLAGQGLLEQHYLGHKLRRRLALNRVDAASAFSSARIAAWLGDTLPGRILSTGARYRIGD